MIKLSKLKKGDQVVIRKWEKMTIFPFRVVRFRGEVFSGPDEKEIYKIVHTHYQIQGHRPWLKCHYKYVSSRYRSELRVSWANK